MSDAKAIKKNAAQHDLFNRLHSIAADERFVQKVAHEWFNDRFEVVANQRCGTWYCDPSSSSKAYAYFKSTDGHTLNWDFNLRRSNLSLATYAEQRAGILLVDSTRRGKRMPDGLSKTVPIWCTVVNRALLRRRKRVNTKDATQAEWDTALYLPAQIVSPSERAQIESRIDSWAEALDMSVLPLPELSKPLRPFFIHPATAFRPEIAPRPSFTPIICLSASRWVNDTDGRGDVIPTATRLGDGWLARTVAFDYVPGAGDDDELWGRGLKPPIYHAYKSTLLSTPREDLPGVVDDLVDGSKDLGAALASIHLDDGTSLGSSRSTREIWDKATPVPGPLSLLALDLGATCRSEYHKPKMVASFVTIRVVETGKPIKDLPFMLPLDTTMPDSPVVVFAVPSARSQPREYINALGALVDHLLSLRNDRPVLISPGCHDELQAALKVHYSSIPITSPISHFQSIERFSSTELQSVRKMLIPLAITLLCALPQLAGRESDALDVDKEAVADYLHSIIALWPDGNPPRAALKRVNEYLMSDER